MKTTPRCPMTKSGTRQLANQRILLSAVVLGLVYFALAAVSPAQTFKELAVFDGTNGSDPTNTDLVQGIDGELYGTTQFGGAANLGTVFKINSAGTLTTLWSFCKENGCPDGDRPMAGLTVVPGGDLYGTTYFGGAHGAGTIFKITPAGALTTVHSFCASFGCADGLNPDAALLLAADGNLYGTTVLGGTGGCGGCHGVESPSRSASPEPSRRFTTSAPDPARMPQTPQTRSRKRATGISIARLAADTVTTLAMSSV